MVPQAEGTAHVWHLPKPGRFGNAGGEKRQDLVRADQGRQAGVRPHRALKPRSGSYLQACRRKPVEAVHGVPEPGRGSGPRLVAAAPSPLRRRLPSPVCFTPRGQCQLWAVWAAAGAQGSLRTERGREWALWPEESGWKAGRPHSPGAPFSSPCSAHRRVQESAEAGGGAGVAGTGFVNRDGSQWPGPLPRHCPLQGLLPAPVQADEDTRLRSAGSAGLTAGFSVSSATYRDAETEVQGVCRATAIDAAGWWPQPREHPLGRTARPRLVGRGPCARGGEGEGWEAGAGLGSGGRRR